MEMKKMMKRNIAKFMILGMTALSAAGAVSTFAPKPVYAAETVTEDCGTVHKNDLLQSEEKAFMEDELNQGELVDSHDNVYVINKNGQKYEYSIYERTVKINEGFSSNFLDNDFSSEKEAEDFMKANMNGVGGIHSERSGFGQGVVHAYLIGDLPVYNITIKTVKQEKCKSLTLENYSSSLLHPGEVAEIHVAKMDGGNPMDLTWECNNSRVSVEPVDDMCYVTASEEVGTVCITAKAPSGVSYCISVNFSN